MTPVLTAIAAGTGTAILACGLSVSVWIAWCEVARALDRRKNARQYVRPRHHPASPPADGSHEACELTEKEALVFGRYASRYQGLGDGIRKGAGT